MTREGPLRWVFEESRSTGADRLVLLAIAVDADDDGTKCWPSMRTIAARARVSLNTVSEAVKRLERAGELLVWRPNHAAPGRHNYYCLTLGRPEHLAAEALFRYAPIEGGTVRSRENGTVLPNRTDVPRETVLPKAEQNCSQPFAPERDSTVRFCSPQGATDSTDSGTNKGHAADRFKVPPPVDLRRHLRAVGDAS